MSSIHVVYLFALLAVLLCLNAAHPSIGHHHREVEEMICEGCADECHKCRYGYTISKVCGTLVCKRGPGGNCGGPSDSWGICGEGLMCNQCNKCVGCSLDTYFCDWTPCRPQKNPMPHLTDVFTVEK